MVFYEPKRKYFINTKRLTLSIIAETTAWESKADGRDDRLAKLSNEKIFCEFIATFFI